MGLRLELIFTVESAGFRPDANANVNFKEFAFNCLILFLKNVNFA